MNTAMSLEDIDIKRKRLIYRSWHRGTREMDLILGRFADQYVPDFTAEELNQYEELLKESDPDIYNWVSGREVPPENHRYSALKRLFP